MRYMTVKNPVKTKHKSGPEGVVSVIVEVPQFDSLQEVVNTAGSEDKLMTWLNKRVEQAAIAGPRNYGTSAAENASLDDVKNKMLELAKGWTFGASRSTESVKTKAEKFDKMKGLIASGNYSQDDLLEILEGIA